VTFVISLLSFLAVFSLMVFAHEFGHFIVSKKAGVRVREFGFGFPLAADRPPSERPLTWKIGQDKSGTVYTFTAIPFGGFVNLGENDPADPESLANFPKRVRMAALLAGPAMNVFLAFVIFIVAALVGYPEFVFGIGIVEVSEGSPAQEAGLQAQDIILGIEDMALDRFTPDAEKAWELLNEMIDYVATRADQQTVVLIQRGIGPDAKQLEIIVTPRANKEGEGKMGISIQPTPVRLNRVRASILDSLTYGLREVLYTIQLTFLIPIQIVRGLLPLGAARTVGPMGIAVMTGEAVKQSLSVDWAYPILHLTGVLNVAIAITNLLPLPAFDGGRIFFILLEAVRGKPVPPEKESLVHSIGMLLMILFFIAVTIQDIFVPLPEGFNWSEYLY
jgi:regulator of sigma E protease